MTPTIDEIKTAAKVKRELHAQFTELTKNMPIETKQFLLDWLIEHLNVESPEFVIDIIRQHTQQE